MKKLETLANGGDTYEVWLLGTGSKYVRRVNRPESLRNARPNPWTRMGDK